MFEIEAYNEEAGQWDLVKEVNEYEFEGAYGVFKTYLNKNIAKTGLRLLNDRGLIVRLCHA
jgi:hypothetical protein